jgi:esterase/lipase superfamily enzyme
MITLSHRVALAAMLIMFAGPAYAAGLERPAHSPSPGGKGSGIGGDTFPAPFNPEKAEGWHLDRPAHSPSPGGKGSGMGEATPAPFNPEKAEGWHSERGDRDGERGVGTGQGSVNSSVGLLIIAVAGVGWLWRRTFRAADSYEIWYGTNRLNRIANTYDGEFGSEIHYGRCTVAIPKGHKLGSTGSSPVRRWFQRLFSGTDDKLTIVKLTPCISAEFLESLKASVEKADPAERSVLVYIHGYNTKFCDAAIQAAQIGFDLKVQGGTVLYSWPSAGEIRAYLQDADNVGASESLIARFIAEVAAGVGPAKVNIIAHSMGNLALTRALNSHGAREHLADVKFGQIILAAPDIDIELFRQLAYVYPMCSDKTTMYISSRDQALATSMWIHNNQRTGYSPPVTVYRGIDTVEATSVDVGLLGHGYYAAAAALLYDIFVLLKFKQDPRQRMGLGEATTSAGEQYWVIRGQN